jgi:hypothetical protein
MKRLGERIHPRRHCVPTRPPAPARSYGDGAPGAVENFADIALGQTAGGLSYKGSQFHRVIENFMVQVRPQPFCPE